jgi:hypothetical protein
LKEEAISKSADTAEHFPFSLRNYKPLPESTGDGSGPLKDSRNQQGTEKKKSGRRISPLLIIYEVECIDTDRYQ